MGLSVILTGMRNGPRGATGSSGRPAGCRPSPWACWLSSPMLRNTDGSADDWRSAAESPLSTCADRRALRTWLAVLDPSFSRQFPGVAIGGVRPKEALLV